MTHKKRPTAAQVLDAIREAAARCRREKEEALAQPPQRTPEEIAAEAEAYMQQQAKEKTVVESIPPAISVPTPKAVVPEKRKPFRVSIRPMRERTVFEEEPQAPPPVIPLRSLPHIERIPLDQRAKCTKPWCMHNVAGNCIHRRCIADIDRSKLPQRDTEARAKKRGNYVPQYTNNLYDQR